ncbi:fumarylacetoacetate hydrolase family protein [Sphingobium sp.]|uniref:fumarylacetoacetate hydrolase family protein n=1 Tax=Sphingobium sp. TaxID=1912891 RepID=UPI0028BD7ACB|nr:fumarylacetoacetate hydrolase family protein [Sphingobium sp.]
MKFVRFDDGRTGVVVGADEDKVLDLTASFPALRQNDQAGADLLGTLLPGNGSGTWKALIESWDSARPVIEKMIRLCEGSASGFRLVPLDGLKLLPPVSNPDRPMFAIGANHIEHIVKGVGGLKGIDVDPEKILGEKRNGLPPWGFTVQPSSLAAHEDNVGPPVQARLFDYESEVGVALRASGRNIEYDRSSIWGYTAVNDLSLRDPHIGMGPLTERGDHSWALDKNFERSKPCGPFMVVDEGIDIENLRVTTRINGELRQDWSTSQMVWKFADAIEWLSKYIPMTSGDMIVSGTGSGCACDDGIDGPNWPKPGDVIEIEVEGVGVLRNHVVASWA